MRIWLVTVGEPIPADAGGQRLLRTGILARMLSQRGHDVTWWNSTFDHSHKVSRYESTTELTDRDGYRLVLLHGRPYGGNVSLARIVNHWQVARSFRLEVARRPEPDVILCSLPLLELCVEAVRYARSHDIPCVLDVRDFWPDILEEMAPIAFRRVARRALFWMRREVRFATRQATAITGITDAAVDWALGYADRRRHESDVAFPHAYRDAAPDQQQRVAAEAFWDEKDIVANAGPITACFIGSLTSRAELDTVLDAAERVGAGGGPKIRWVICGTGEDHARLAERASRIPSVVMPGWVTAAQIWVLMRRAHVGLLPYRSSFDFVRSYPNKVAEYLSAGLPIVSSLRGQVEALIQQRMCGVSYRNEDVAALASAVRELSEHPAQRFDMARNARAVFLAEFMAETVYNSFCEYLEGFGARRARSAPSDSGGGRDSRGATSGHRAASATPRAQGNSRLPDAIATTRSTSDHSPRRAPSSGQEPNYDA